MQEHSKKERWLKAQRAELDWWRRWRRLPFYRSHSFPDYWAERLRSLGLDLDLDQSKQVVEVGCGPFGVVSYLFPSCPKVGIDPLITEFPERAPRPELGLYVRAIGERLPLKSESADLAICINVLDHVISPIAILSEIKRVLRPCGQLVLEVHTFPRPLIPFLAFDGPHTEHLSFRKVLSLVEQAGLELQRINDVKFRVPLPASSLLTFTGWKYLVGNLFMNLTFILARKPA